MTTAELSPLPSRSVFLGVDVGNGSARAGDPSFLYRLDAYFENMCVCKWTYLSHAHMNQMTEKASRDMEACGWDDEFWEEIGLGDLVDGHHAKSLRSVCILLLLLLLEML
ncbi:unnamed protein product [Microthlaspi erraticum]|uniref:Uncharacterized protein n=1 Tax=Microthlaspi erraticum TaxID=1685480 RepID=A0A6D2KHQ2_9BRAS|nr:unnamed protein product [Microthlaspi erraticum]